jgi:ABC-type multidrug transport system fused ATPase/permease subunit
LENIRGHTTKRTSLIVSHRLSHVRHADLIIVLDKGRVTETGTHGELMALGGYYSKLYRWQEIEEELEAVNRNS